jgi:hypothetical protein
MGIGLYGYQYAALKRMHNGCILCGGVGSGKSRTSLAYYYTQMGGHLGNLPGEKQTKMIAPRDLYIITTARKRDTLEWEDELRPFGIIPPSKRVGKKDDPAEVAPEQYIYPNLKVTIDSWNNIKKYGNVYGAFFIFDEQRVVGTGAWAKTFIKLAKRNQWILLSATPGDTWSDYIPVFIANGFYKNKTEFSNQHCVYSRFTKYPKVERYIDQGILMKHRAEILVTMDFERKTTRHAVDIWCGYDMALYKQVMKERWDVFNDCPVENAGVLCYILRRVVNECEERRRRVVELVCEKKRAIIFYNFDYELEILRGCLDEAGILYSEWNGHAHERIPEGDEWAYLVQYTAGAEGWNCTSCDTVIFYSQNYSYKIVEQASGRIDRLNTPYTDLYYYHLKSRSGIDLAISRALKNKKNFNESRWVDGMR